MGAMDATDATEKSAGIGNENGNEGGRRGAGGSWVEAIGVALAYLGFGAAFAAALAAPLPAAEADPYARAAVTPSTPTTGDASNGDWPSARIWLVDGYNVLHAGLLNREDRERFWSRAHRERLRARVECFGEPAQEIWIVFDGERASDETGVSVSGASVRTVFAPSADDWLVRRVRESSAPAQLAVVTGDRQVAGRARHRGAHVVSPRRFLERCPVG